MEQPNWTPAELLQLSGGYWSACALHAGVKLAVFTHVAAERLSAQELAGRLGADRRGLTMLLNALAAMGLVEKEGTLYRGGAFACQYLDRNSPDYLGHIIMHHHHLMASWAYLDEAVQRGRPLRERVSHAADSQVRESFELGMFNLAMLIAPRLVAQVDLAGRHRLLDLGGGPGTYAIQFCLHNPGLTAVVYDLPSTRPFAEQTIARFGLAERVAFAAGDFEHDGLPGRFDVAWLSHILHGEGPAACAALLRKAVAALEPGGCLLVQEFILTDSQAGPLFPTLFSLNMLLGTEAGQSYSEGELAAMLDAAGLRGVRRLPVELPNGAGVMVGVVPQQE